MILNDGKKLDNVLSVSTAASNKYLFHFNSFNSLTQWTAGIRLAMYEHTTLQEAYTGALIAGKGRSLNNIRVILDRQRARHDDWARVRFGAGTPWRRCWCVVNPPDEKEYAKLQKAAKKNLYNRSPVILKGDIKFYDTKKITKKTRPIATVTDAYSCYAIYPQSKPLIDQSTLVKIEGKITIHGSTDSVTEGFVFVMPETHPAVSGFEILLRFLFPVFDTFALYGRPNKLIADVLDTRGLMFAMPPDRRYGYLEMWDVVGLIHTEGSQNWSERQWRKQLKELTSKRMLAAPSRTSSRATSRRNTLSRVSLPPSRSGTVRFGENGAVQSQPGTRSSSPTRGGEGDIRQPKRVDSAPPSSYGTPRHQRSVSEAHGYKKYMAETPSRLAHGVNADTEPDTPPPPPEHRQLNGSVRHSDTSSEEIPSPDSQNLPEVRPAPSEPPRGPVDHPPSFAHAPSQRPPVRPYMSNKPHADIDSSTLDQLADATQVPIAGGIAAAGAVAAWRTQENGRRSSESDRSGHQLHPNGNSRGYGADQYVNSSHSGHSGSRLPTIPASPYIEQPEFVGSQPTSFQPAAPPVPEHRAVPQAGMYADLVHRPHPDSTESSIHRKPVPGRSSLSAPRGEFDNRSTTSSSLGSLRNNVIDPEALDSLDVDSSLIRNPSMSSSRYDDDGMSTSTPDYASTISEEVQPRKVPARREDRPRSGVLKTIGTADPNRSTEVVVGDAHYKPDGKRTDPSADIPVVDFGPTYSLAPGTNNRPGTSGTMTQNLHDANASRSKENLVYGAASRSRENLAYGAASRSRENLVHGNASKSRENLVYGNASKSRENLAPSPGEQKRQSWLSGRATPNGPLHMRSNSASPLAQESRSVPWQPGMAAPIPSDKQKLDADEWVAARAAAAYQPRSSPVYAHGRSKSHTPPPVSRNHSGDWTHLQRTPDAMPQRPPSRPLSRPVSRGATHLLDQRPTSLSAREQEQVARMTGTPLIDLAHNKRKPQEATADGLAGYIDHREKEKAKAKANHSTAAMQAEIDRRMMAAQQRQMMEMQHMGQQQAQAQQMSPSITPQMHIPGGFPTPTPQGYPPAFAFSSQEQLQMYQQPGYFPQQGVSPMMAQGMQPGWGAGTPSPQSQMQGPYFAQQQQQQPQQVQMQPQQRYTQPYGASFDQAQAAARFAHQNR